MTYILIIYKIHWGSTAHKINTLEAQSSIRWLLKKSQTKQKKKKMLTISRFTVKGVEQQENKTYK